MQTRSPLLLPSDSTVCLAYKMMYKVMVSPAHSFQPSLPPYTAAILHGFLYLVPLVLLPRKQSCPHLLVISMLGQNVSIPRSQHRPPLPSFLVDDVEGLCCDPQGLRSPRHQTINLMSAAWPPLLSLRSLAD